MTSSSGPRFKIVLANVDLSLEANKSFVLTLTKVHPLHPGVNLRRVRRLAALAAVVVVRRRLLRAGRGARARRRRRQILRSRRRRGRLLPSRGRAHGQRRSQPGGLGDRHAAAVVGLRRRQRRGAPRGSPRGAQVLRGRDAGGRRGVRVLATS